jgi:hypothetical protein
MYSGKTVEELIKLKEDVITDLYLTGRYNKMYFGRYSNLKINPLKSYINRFLKINGVYLDNNELCEECYQTAFYYLARKPPEWFIKVLEESENGTKLVATLVFIIRTQCFSLKDNPKSSGLIFNILNNSSYGGIPISTSEVYNDGEENKKEIIIYDEPEPDVFESRYELSVEDFVNELSPGEKELFFMMVDKKSKRGKPSKEIQQSKQLLFDKLKQVNHEKKSDLKLTPKKAIDSSIKKYKTDAEIKEEMKNFYN